jgi:hypothetical protein
MKIRKHEDTFIELVAENARETKLLGELFNGIGKKRYCFHSFGYDRKLSKRNLPSKEWAKKLVLTFKLEE